MPNKDNHLRDFRTKHGEALPATVRVYMPGGKYEMFRASEGRVITYENDKVFIGSIDDKNKFNVDRIYSGFPYICQYEEQPY